MFPKLVSISTQVDRAISVFTKVQKDLEDLIDKGSKEVVNLDTQITALEVEKTDVKRAMQKALNVKSKILDIVGDDS